MHEFTDFTESLIWNRTFSQFYSKLYFCPPIINFKLLKSKQLTIPHPQFDMISGVNIKGESLPCSGSTDIIAYKLRFIKLEVICFIIGTRCSHMFI